MTPPRRSDAAGVEPRVPAEPPRGAVSPGGAVPPRGAGLPDGGVPPRTADLPRGAGLPDGGVPPRGAGLPDGGVPPRGAGLPDGGVPPRTADLPRGAVSPGGAVPPRGAGLPDGGVPPRAADLPRGAGPSDGGVPPRTADLPGGAVPPGGGVSSRAAVSPRGGVPVAFPFSAIVGQEDLREALLACAVDPAIGGVLVRGERGTAKTTAVRGLAPLVGSLVELPIGATADRVLGTLDLDRALAEGAAALRPGLLASADGGLLYVDEVNLLPDHLVDVLLDAAALGRVHVERDGLSAAYDARFVLVGTMNPEEGDLRPQLLDRFGLSVEVTGSLDPAVRVEIVRRRLAFDRDPARFAASWAVEEAALGERVAAARARAVRLPDRIVLLIAGTCARLGVDGHRADIVCARAATALAALDGDDEVTAEHVRRAARLALAHRRRRGPLQAPGLDESELDAALSEAEDDDFDPPPNGGGGGAQTEGCGTNLASEERFVHHPPDDERAYRADAPSRERTDAPGDAGRAPLLSLAGRGRGAAGRRSRAEGGPAVDSREPAGPVTDLAIAATLRAAMTRRAIAAPGGHVGRVAAARGLAAPRRPAFLLPSDVREHVRAGKEGNLVVFCVDASGSMGAQRRMARVKGAVLGLLNDAYQRRDRVALVTFRGETAELVLPPTSSVERAAHALAKLPTGGRTPLALGLNEAERVIRQEARRDPTRRALALVVTDGRATQRDAVAHAAARLAHAAHGVVVFDGEHGPVRLNLARDLAEAANAQLLPLEALAA